MRNLSCRDWLAELLSQNIFYKGDEKDEIRIKIKKIHKRPFFRT